MKNKEVIKLSEVASNVQYIQIETKKECLLSQKPEYFFIDSLIFINNGNYILKFSRNGKFLKKIGNPGRGPGEIDLIKTMSILHEERLIAVHKGFDKKILFFSFNGELVKTVIIPSIQNVFVMNNDQYIAYESGYTGSEKYTFRLTNEFSDTLSIITNHLKWDNHSNRVMYISYRSFNPFYIYHDRCSMKAMYNDTVYSVISNSIIPSYFVDLGKYKLPDELRPERPGASKLFLEKSKAFYYFEALEANNRIFLTFSNYEGDDMKYVLFFKSEGILLIDENGESKGLINDWDGGLNFWPISSISDSEVYMPINAIDFKEMIKNGFTDSSINSLSKEDKTKQLISNLEITDNPILMVVTLKK